MGFQLNRVEGPLGETPTDPADAEAQCRLLLTDSEGWAGLYDGSTATRRQLGRNFGLSELGGEPPYEHAHLITPTGEVLPADGQGRESAFDEEDYAEASCTFSAVDAAGRKWTYTVPWRVDGRV
jgi:hypothetical protein